jgi:5-oxopent-3-ene-1,2,5-tricarboxylate decarboxylase/2-hydroxyhepta-2,4-diene-1,7-dioate isomerase
VVNVVPGDVVACEIEGLGRLVNTIAADAEFGR